MNDSRLTVEELKLFYQGIKEFNNMEYFESHDTLEDLWRGYRKEDRLYFQGLIHVAVGMYHLTMGKRRGAKSQFSKALKKLQPYLPEYNGIDLESLYAHITEFRAQLAGAGHPGLSILTQKNIPRMARKPPVSLSR